MNVHELLKQLRTQGPLKTTDTSTKEKKQGGEAQSREGLGATEDSSPGTSPPLESLPGEPKPDALAKVWRMIEQRKQRRLRENERVAKQPPDNEDQDWRKMMRRLGRG